MPKNTNYFGDAQASIFELKEEQENKQELNLPKCFNDDYYEDKINRCDHGSDNWYRWSSLRRYMLKVKTFYIALMVKLNTSIDKPVNLPGYIKLEENPKPIDMKAKDLQEQEEKLMKCFDDSNSKFEKKLEKHSTLQELREYGAKCWLLYQNLTRDNYYHAIIDFKSRNEDKDLTVERNIALLFVGHTKTKSFVKTKVKDYFSTNRLVNPFKEKQPKSIGVYANLPTEPLFASIMETFNGYNYLENEEWFKNIIPQLTDEKAIQVVEFYKNYSHIKVVYKKLLYIAKNYNDGYEADFLDYDYIEKTSKKRYYVPMAEEYLTQINSLFQMAEKNEEYAFVLKDKHLQHKLIQALSLCSPIYNAQVAEREEHLKSFKEKYSEIDLDALNNPKNVD